MRSSSLALVPAAPTADAGRGAHARTSLILAAAEVFGESSLDSATTREIAQRAGQNVASISYYFGSKEGLYIAVAEHIRELVLSRVQPLLGEITGFLAGSRQAPERCLDYFGRLLSAALATNSEMLAVTALIVREQLHPTKGFTILYEGVLGRMHETGAALICAYTGIPKGSEESIVRYHALLGQSLAFRFARETIVRRAGWSTIGKREEDLVQQVVTEQACDALRALRRRRGGEKA